MKVVAAMKSIQGKRQVQQDRYGFMQIKDNAFLIICDGNGGAGGGELANAAITSVISECCTMFSEKENTRITSEELLKKTGLEIMDKAAKDVMNVKKTNSWDSAGTTITLVVLNNKFISLFWLGDSPVYIYRGGNLENLIIPHTLAEELIRSGQSRELISQQPAVNSVLTQCAGYEPCKPEAKIAEILEPCIVIAGSDGLFNFLEQDNMIVILQDKLFSCLHMQELCTELVTQSYQNGSDDNITAIAARYSRECETDTKKKLTRLFE